MSTGSLAKTTTGRPFARSARQESALSRQKSAYPHCNWLYDFFGQHTSRTEATTQSSRPAITPVAAKKRKPGSMSFSRSRTIIMKNTPALTSIARMRVRVVIGSHFVLKGCKPQPRNPTCCDCPLLKALSGAARIMEAEAGTRYWPHRRSARLRSCATFWGLARLLKTLPGSRLHSGVQRSALLRLAPSR